MPCSDYGFEVRSTSQDDDDIDYSLQVAQEENAALNHSVNMLEAMLCGVLRASIASQGFPKLCASYDATKSGIALDLIFDWFKEHCLEDQKKDDNIEAKANKYLAEIQKLL